MNPFYYLSNFPERKSVGKNYVAECPKCHKKNLYISKSTGLMHCFTAGCGFSGKLKDFWEERPFYGSQPAPAQHRATAVRTTDLHTATESAPRTDVAMIPADYKRLTPEVQARIKSLADDPESPDADRQAALRYLAHQGISPATALAARVGCLSHRCYGKDDKQSAGSIYHCIAYVNYINGQPVNAKYRSCDPSAAPAKDADAKPEYTKFWAQDSPTTPCAPYNIDCINPLLVPDDEIPRLIITEGEKDVLSLLEAGYPHVISVPNGAASDLRRTFEAFDSWFDQVREVVICGDTDLPGRTLTRHLTEYFGMRSLLVTLPDDCKDISDVLVTYGPAVVRDIIESARPPYTTYLITVAERSDEVFQVLQGQYDRGYSVGYGPLTDRIFHPTDQGGLIIVTGKPNCGKTDFLNDLTCRIMAKTGRHVCYLSFEVPDKNKHIAHLVRLMLGKVRTETYTREQLQPILDYLNAHMMHLDLHEVSPTPENILDRADQVRRVMPLKYLVIDPYLFLEVKTGSTTTETQAIKTMLTQLQGWGRRHRVWVVIVAHPRKLQKLTGRNELEDIDMYTIAGSANWANLADFIFALTRVKEQDRAYTRLDMLKVRDQDLCQTGSVLYVRQRCGRYDERESEEQIIAEMQGKILQRDTERWGEG